MTSVKHIGAMPFTLRPHAQDQSSGLNKTELIDLKGMKSGAGYSLGNSGFCKRLG